MNMPGFYTEIVPPQAEKSSLHRGSSFTGPEIARSAPIQANYTRLATRLQPKILSKKIFFDRTVELGLDAPVTARPIWLMLFASEKRAIVRTPGTHTPASTVLTHYAMS